MRAAIYTRISADQAGEALGVQRQLEDCLDLAERLDWKVVEQFDDNDLSAFSGKTRPGFEALLAGMERGDFAAVLCWHTDRLYRSMKDLERLIDIAEAGSVQIKTVNSGDIDLSNSGGRMIARILGSVARQESEHKGERHRRANQQKAQRGEWQAANRPFGYTMTGEPLEPEATMIRNAITDVLAGKSIRQVAREWNASGVKGTKGSTWDSAAVGRVLKNARIAARKVHQRRVIGPGNWEAIVDSDTFDGFIALVSDPARITCTSYEKKYMGSFVYRCGKCGALMRHAIAGNPAVRRYECTNGQHLTRKGEQVDQVVQELVLARLSSSQVRLTLDHGEEVDIAEVQARRAAIQAKLNELSGMFADGAIDGDQLRTGTNKLRTQLSEVESILADLARRSPAADLIAAGESIREEWAKLSADIKGKVIDETATIRIMPSPRGRREFQPELIVPEWKI
jgi:site-specific DNA recombinase